jgi:hypothetical protein
MGTSVLPEPWRLLGRVFTVRLMRSRTVPGRFLPLPLFTSRARAALVSLGVTCLVLLALPHASLANLYGYAELDGGGYHGSDVTLNSSDLWVSDYTTLFAASDSWVNNGAYWVEAMINYGTCGGARAYVFFCWADQRPNGGGYHEHAGPAASLNTSYDDKITYAGSGNWAVDVGGFTGTSTNSFTSSTYLQTGTEVYVNGVTTNAKVCSQQSQLAWYGLSDVKHSNWVNGSYSAFFYQDKPPYTYWVNQNASLRDYENHPTC